MNNDTDGPSVERWRQRFNQALVFGSAIIIVLVLSLVGVTIVLTGRLKAARGLLDEGTTEIVALRGEVTRLRRLSSGTRPPLTSRRVVTTPAAGQPETPMTGGSPVGANDTVPPSAVAVGGPVASQPSPANDIEARRLLGEAAVRRGDYAAARRELEPVLAENPADASARLWFGQALFHLGQLDDADRQFEWLTANTPKSPEGFYWRGMVRLRRMEADRALPFFDQAVAAGPAFAPAWESAGIALANLGKLDEALQRLDEAARLAPAAAEIVLAQAVCYARLDRRQDVLDALHRALTLDPKLIDRARTTPALDHVLTDEDWHELSKR